MRPAIRRGLVPDGDPLGFGQNSINGTQTLSLRAYTNNPAVGRWTLVIDFAEPVVGDEISQPFTGNIACSGPLPPHRPAATPGLRPAEYES
jgi:hypothetical protein